MPNKKAKTAKKVGRVVAKTAKAIKKHNFQKDVRKGVRTAEKASQLLALASPVVGEMAGTQAALMLGAKTGQQISKSKLLKKKK